MTHSQTLYSQYLRSFPQIFPYRTHCQCQRSMFHYYCLLLSLSLFPTTTMTTKLQKERIQQLQDIIGTDAGNRGMKALIVPGDLEEASRIFGQQPKSNTIILLSGFPCCVHDTPPTETDGPPGTVALARAALALGMRVVVVTDDCNREVFAAALERATGTSSTTSSSPVQLVSFGPNAVAADFEKLASSCDLLVACERAGPGPDGRCYTMRGTDMTGLVAPLHLLVEQCRAAQVPFLAVGDGGNEMGMGRVRDRIVKNIPKGGQIGCVVAADRLIAASVSNWGGYALAAGAALMRAGDDEAAIVEWVDKCLPTEQDEIDLLNRCVACGCRDGVSGKVEATVDGMPLETSLQCLRDIRRAALGGTSE